LAGGAPLHDRFYLFPRGDRKILEDCANIQTS